MSSVQGGDLGVAVVTGGGRGIGRAAAIRLASAGWSVVVMGRDQGALDATVSAIEVASGEARPIRCDVTSEDQVREAFKRLERIDVLVNNAGASTSAPLARTTLEQWRFMIDVNATSAFLCLREVVPKMTCRGSGRVIVISSTAGVAGMPYISAYTAAKHATVGLVRAVASELAGTGVTVNAVCPTYVHTDMTERSVSALAESTGRESSAVLANLEHSSPLGRLLSVDEVAAAVEYLSSAEAGAVNGQALVLDGGGIWR